MKALAAEPRPWITAPAEGAFAAFAVGDRVRLRGSDGCQLFAEVLVTTDKTFRVRVDAAEGRRGRVCYELWFDPRTEWPTDLALAEQPAPGIAAEVALEAGAGALGGGGAAEARGGALGASVDALPVPPFKTILCDPPWTFRVWGDTMGSRSTSQHYEVQDAAFLRGLNLADVAHPESTLLMWATIPHLPEALELITAWGFSFRSAIVWAKMSRAAAPRIGLGYHARNCAELLLIAQRGSPGAPLPADRPHGLMFSPPGEHSRKPDWQYDIAENYPGPWLELFCRPRFDNLFGPRRDWRHLGNEVDGKDIKVALQELASLPNCDIISAGVASND